MPKPRRSTHRKSCIVTKAGSEMPVSNAVKPSKAPVSLKPAPFPCSAVEIELEDTVVQLKREKLTLENQLAASRREVERLRKLVANLDHAPTPSAS